jgi:hypothetical protein
MAKGKDLGWAKPDDPIYQSVPMIHFKPSAHLDRENGVKTRHNLRCNLMPTETGRFVVVFDYFNWEGGSCLDSTAPRIALLPAKDEADLYFDSKVDELSVAMMGEIGKTKPISGSHWGLSGYTWYCVLFESDDTLDEAGWRSVVSADDENLILKISNLIKRLDGYDAQPVVGGFKLKRIKYSDIEEKIYAAFMP